jgi:hypothetical protein
MEWPWCLQGCGILSTDFYYLWEKEKTMVITINKSDSKKAIEKKLKGLPNKGFQAYKYLGKVKIDGDGLAIQKQLRDGWKKRPS